jgi:hypothetical protein
VAYFNTIPELAWKAHESLGQGGRSPCYNHFRATVRRHPISLCSSTAVRVEMYASFSPCKNCCRRITDFIAVHPGCCVRIAFSCVYRYFEDTHSAALRELNSNQAITRLDVFKNADWHLLKRRGHLDLSRDAWSDMRTWDIIWRDRLTAILHPGLCHVRSKVSTAVRTHIVALVGSDPSSLKETIFSFCI